MGYMLSGPLLQMTGFSSGLEGAALERALINMRIGYIALPVTGLVIAAIILKFFPLNAKRLGEIRGQLEERRGKV